VNIRLGIPSTAGLERVGVDVYDVRGRHVRQVHDKALEPGFHQLRWDGKGKFNQRVSSGIYFMQVTWKGNRVSSKVVLMR
jgi:flagellar hook assembly protein FlgD